MIEVVKTKCFPTLAKGTMSGSLALGSAPSEADPEKSIQQGRIILESSEDATFLVKHTRGKQILNSVVKVNGRFDSTFTLSDGPQRVSVYLDSNGRYFLAKSEGESPRGLPHKVLAHLVTLDLTSIEGVVAGTADCADYIEFKSSEGTAPVSDAPTKPTRGRRKAAPAPVVSTDPPATDLKSDAALKIENELKSDPSKDTI